MPHRQDISIMPATRDSASLLAVDRAVHELRRGRMVAIAAAEGQRALVLAAEAVTPDALDALESLSGTAPELIVTHRRATMLGLLGDTLSEEGSVLGLTLKGGLNADAALALADPVRSADVSGAQEAALRALPRHGPASAAIGLAKVARLLPAAIVAPLEQKDTDDLAAWCARHDLLLVDAGDIFQYERTAARTLRPVSDARVPLMDAEHARIIAFRPEDGGLEHLAIVIGQPTEPALVRLHSECFTGDLLGSLRCDCGDQLRGAIASIGESGAGVLLYLAQEGRGIGLVNKLRAYTLQDRGLDTLDANEQLGFDADERVYLPAAEMLKHLGLRQVKLLTNNPDKVTAMSRFGIDVIERVPHAFPSNKHNEAYLHTKAAKGGHLF